MIHLNEDVQANDESLREAKRSARARALRILDEIDSKELLFCGEVISRHIAGLDIWRKAITIFAFLSMGNEIDTNPVLRASLANGKRVGVPRVYGRMIRFHEIPSIDLEWEIHPYGVREPSAKLEELPANDPSIHPLAIITPGLSFDRRGGRLGHGGGFYDRFFSTIETASPSPRDRATRTGGTHTEVRIRSIGEITDGEIVSIGVCVSTQIEDEIPRDESDVPVDYIVTERGVEYERIVEPA